MRWFAEMEIAVLFNDEMRTSTFTEAGIIKVYEKNHGTWLNKRSIPYEVSLIPNLKEIRLIFRDLLVTLGQCKIIVVKEIQGLPYNILDSSGFNIWEIDSTGTDFLDYVLENEMLQKQADTSINMEPEVSVYPTEISPGCYSINLNEIQKSNSKVTSKQAILPFISNTVFYELEVICSHIPPWFQQEFQKFNLNTEVIQLSDKEYKIIVSHKICEN